MPRFAKLSVAPDTQRLGHVPNSLHLWIILLQPAGCLVAPQLTALPGVRFCAAHIPDAATRMHCTAPEHNCLWTASPGLT